MSKIRLREVRWLGLALLSLTLPMAASPLAAEGAGSAPAEDPSILPSEILPRAAKSLLLDVTGSEAGFVAVGERGHVLISHDGNAWTQVETPTRSTLTVVTSAGGQLWAGGHDGVILHSADGGQHWQAQRRDPYHLAEGENPADHDPRQGAPILDLMFSDASNGIAVGAHSLMLVTGDGGATWTAKQAIASAPEPATAAPMHGDLFSEADLQLDEESDPHLNAVARLESGDLVIVGERGTFLRSSNAGDSWQKSAFPYKGSMFGILSLGGNRLLAYGLRGNVYESSDLGSHWSKVETHGSANLLGGCALANGGTVLVGSNGTFLIRTSADAAFAARPFKNASGETPTLAGVAQNDKGDYLLVGDKGVDLFHPQ